MNSKIDREQLEPEAAALYRQGMGFKRLERELNTRYGERARARSTYQRWAKERPDLWRPSAGEPAQSSEELQRAQADSPRPEPGETDVSVAAEITRLRHVRGRVDALLDRAETLASGEANELKILFKVEEDLQRRVDPDRMLDWLERFIRWAAENAEPQDRERIAAAARGFAENVFGVIHAAAQPRGSHT